MRTLRVDTISQAETETIWTAEGVDVETGERFLFAGDWRPMRELGVAVGEANATGGEYPLAQVEPWQVLGLLVDPV